MEWLRADADTPSLAAALAKLRSSAMTAKAAKLPQSSRFIAEGNSVFHANCTPLSQGIRTPIISTLPGIGRSATTVPGKNCQH
jgi:hypothetical protein